MRENEQSRQIREVPTSGEAATRHVPRSPAPIYKDSKLTAAQQDDENRKSSLMPPATRIGIPTPTGMHYAEPIWRVTRTTQIRRQYYMNAFIFCADAVEPRFAADARLLIDDPATFGTRVVMPHKHARTGLRSLLPRSTSIPTTDILIILLAIRPRCGKACRGG